MKRFINFKGRTSPNGRLQMAASKWPPPNGRLQMAASKWPPPNGRLQMAASKWPPPKWTSPKWTSPKWTSPKWTSPKWTSPKWTSPKGRLQKDFCFSPNFKAHSGPSVMYMFHDFHYIHPFPYTQCSPNFVCVENMYAHGLGERSVTEVGGGGGGLKLTTTSFNFFFLFVSEIINDLSIMPILKSPTAPLHPTAPPLSSSHTTKSWSSWRRGENEPKIA